MKHSLSKKAPYQFQAIATMGGWLLWALAFTFNVQAQSDACQSTSPCVAENSWSFGVAVGLGGQTNPLQDGDPIPLILLPDIAWYGKKAYYDNTELGYQWHSSQDTAAEAFVSLNTERALFSFWHPANILLPMELNTSGLPSPDEPMPSAPTPTEGSPMPDPPSIMEDDTLLNSTPVSIDGIQSRRWGIDVGIRWHWYRDNAEWQLAFTTDASGVHHGQQLQLSYQRNWQWQDWQWGAQMSATWKSQQLIDYYYGLRENDNVALQSLYQGGAGWQPQVQFNISKAITSKWHWLSKISYQHLHSGMSNSPLVRKNRIVSGFMGIAYRFN